MKKAGFIVLYISIHFLIVRPVRTQMFLLQTRGIDRGDIEQLHDVSVQKMDVRLIYFEFKLKDHQKILHYKIPFGFFFLIGIIGLILADAKKEEFLFLIAVHGGVTILATLILWYGVYVFSWTLFVLDLISRYLVPMTSIGLIPIAFLEKYKLDNERSI